MLAALFELKLWGTFITLTDNKAVLQARLLGVVPNIAPEMPQLRFTADDVIEKLCHPERTASAKEAINLKRTAAFPVTHDFAQGDFLGWLDERMNVIRHDAPSIELVGGAMACEQALDKPFSAVRSCEEAFAMPGIEEIVKLGGELAMILMTVFFGECRWISGVMG